MPITRRDFVCSSALIAAAGVVEGAPLPAGEALGSAKGPIVISSLNGERSCAEAVKRIGEGVHPLDAVVAGINIVENDPNDDSVGYGGLPNEEGVVSLDSCVMDGPTGKGGAVACIEKIKNPSSVAVLVMRRTDHVLIVGDGARRFAVAHGFPEENLLTEASRKKWLEWRESHSDTDDWLGPEKGAKKTTWIRRPGVNWTTGTITCMALHDGNLYGCTSTSGLSYKIPGRVGDSPILGAGLFVDNEVGACGSTGRGEANLQNCSSFLAVELMRQGRTPAEACREVLKRIAGRCEPRLRDAKGAPDFGLTFYAIRKDGEFGGATMRERSKMAVNVAGTPQVVELEPLFAKS
ncbi:MAG: N(4)-(beta-N-acetylglucosaminyl)-L-asparaginase [Phycisphaerales bacterium]|nr:N(4)-(beta-N-acetylglucosaminyl)-L-asparaginase [Phycisphaerales bacterium]